MGIFGQDHSGIGKCYYWDGQEVDVLRFNIVCNDTVSDVQDWSYYKHFFVMRPAMSILSWASVPVTSIAQEEVGIRARSTSSVVYFDNRNAVVAAKTTVLEKIMKMMS